MPPKHSQPAKIAIVGTYLPQRCGIATFSSDLYASLTAADPAVEVSAVAVNDRAEPYEYPNEVQFEIDQKAMADYRLAVDFLDLNSYDAVSLQHEYGIFGGNAGNYVLRLLHNLRLPVVTTLHTVLQEPDQAKRDVMAAVGELSDRMVVMSERAGQTLADVYGIPRERISVIPHGVPDMPFLDTSYHKDKYRMVGRKVILTFGLISRGKGLEYAVEAMPAIVARHPDAVFLIAGQTHPGVRRHEGESYRTELQQRASELGVADNVVFRDRFLDTDELIELLSIADVVVTPYLNKEQIVSGVLSFALGAGKAIVSTPYWYAEEMLDDGRGRIVPFRDSEAIAREVIDLLDNDVERQTMRKRAYDFARHMVWSRVGAEYLKVFREVRAERRLKPRIYRARKLQLGGDDHPLPRFDHLHVLTDDTGILQHSRFAVPDRDHGYCTDDNARALIVALMARGAGGDGGGGGLMPLAYRYMSFLQHAYNQKERRFRNFMSFDRRWQETIGSEDSHGRALWALGRCVLDAPSQGLVGAAMALFEEALPAAQNFRSPRSWAFALIGIDAYLARFSGASDARRTRSELAGRLYRQFVVASGPDWPWIEDTVTYANGVIAEALILSGHALANAEMSEAGLKALRWLVDIQTDPRGHFTPIGNAGWRVRGRRQARFDQQPIEIQHMVDALLTANRVTGDQAWLEEARRCHDWFLGRNDLQQIIADRSTGGCRDGLQSVGVNQNQGAESTLAWLHSSLRMHAVLGAIVPAEEEQETRRRGAANVVPLASRGIAAPH